jgi:hypothetical protein
VLASCGGVEDSAGVEALQFASAVLGAIRKKKSEEQRPLKTPVALTVVRAPATLLALLPAVEADLRASGLIQELQTAEAATLQVDVTLAPAEAAAEQRTP